ncbi:MAG TPA: N-acetyltransferase [Bacillota bacterium]|nr:N-acetyltransferase [Bacillota bacterium]
MVTYRKAKMQDVETLHALVNQFAEQGLMLPRSRNTLYETLREFMLIENDGVVIGAGALHIIWEDLAEVRALAILPEFHGKGLGKQLIMELLNEARALGIHQVFALTYQVEFFKKCGFKQITKEEMPHKVWKECINCPKFPNCDEVALIINLD